MTFLEDAALHDRARRLLGARHAVWAAATVSGGEVRIAVHGTTRDGDFEIGSVSKAVTGLLYADAVARGEITGETRLGDLLPLGNAGAADVTLGSLAVHRSGLPRLPSSADSWRKTVALWRHGTNPYGESLAELVEQARRAQPGAPRPLYSNFGFELLGHAIAAAAQLSYAELVAARLTTPLGMHGSYVPSNAHELRGTAVVGTSRRGKPREPWTGEALAPAGGIRATIDDMATMVSSILSGNAPGLGALDPVETLAGVTRIGAAWLTTPVRGRTVTWHNGGTGGFRSWIGIDRAAVTGAVVMTATSRSVDRCGFELVKDLDAR